MEQAVVFIPQKAIVVKLIELFRSSFFSVNYLKTKSKVLKEQFTSELRLKTILCEVKHKLICHRKMNLVQKNHTISILIPSTHIFHLLVL